MPLSFTLGKATYTLSDECMRRMALTMDRTVTRERGFPLMGPLNNIQAGKEHIGGKMGIIPRGEGRIGYFHTHTDGEPSLSEADWEAAIIHCSDFQIPYLECSGAKGEVWCTTVDDIKALPKRPRGRTQWHRLAKDIWTVEILERASEHLVKPFVFHV